MQKYPSLEECDGRETAGERGVGLRLHREDEGLAESRGAGNFGCIKKHHG
jgi:hypothetical protein